MNGLATFKNWLNHIPFLNEEDCSLFEASLRVKNYAAKDYLLDEGKICREIGFVIRGCFRTFYLLDGKEINTHFTFENEFVTDYHSSLHGKPSRYCIQALEASEIVSFSVIALQKAYQQSQNWERFGRLMAEQAYTQTTRRVESFLFLDGQQRYLQLLENQPLIFDRIPLYHIASYLGLERESLSRLRKKISDG